MSKYRILWHVHINIFLGFLLLWQTVRFGFHGLPDVLVSLFRLVTKCFPDWCGNVAVQVFSLSVCVRARIAFSILFIFILHSIMLCIRVFDVLMFFRPHQHFFIFLINTEKQNYNKIQSDSI